MTRINYFPFFLTMSIMGAGNACAAPILLDDLYTPNALSYTVNASGFLSNDSSAVGGLRTTSIDTTGTQGAVVAFADGRFTFTPAVGLSTNTSFIYRAADSSGASGTATVTFDMVSTLPKALSESYTPNATTFAVSAPVGVLANDTGGIGGLKVTSIDVTGTQGAVSAFSDGSFSFKPTVGLSTNTSFTYTASDQLGRTSSEAVTFDMISTLPKAIDDYYVMLAGDALSIGIPGLLGNDAGGIGGLRATSVDITGTHGSVAAFFDGHFNFDPTAGFFGNTSFSYTMADALGRSSSATVFLSVNRNDVPEPNTFALLIVALGVLAFTVEGGVRFATSRH